MPDNNILEYISLSQLCGNVCELVASGRQWVHKRNNNIKYNKNYRKKGEKERHNTN